MKLTISLLALLTCLTTTSYSQICDDFTDSDIYPENSFTENDTVGYSQGGTQAIVIRPSEWGDGYTIVNTFDFQGIYIIEYGIDFEFDGSSQSVTFERYGYSGADTEEGFSINGSDTIYLDDTFPMTIDGVIIDLDSSAPAYDSWDTDYLIFSGEIENIKLVGVEFGIKNLCTEEYSPDDVSIESNDLSLTKLYPNPSHNSIEVQREGKIDRIAIYTVTGELVMSIDKINSTGTIINIEALENGPYFLQVYEKSGTTTATKFLKN